MPRPVYLICAEAVAEDKRTNKFSMFNTIEKVTIRGVAAAAEAGRPIEVPLLQCRIVTSWIRLPQDGYEFESQVAIVKTDGTEEAILDFPFTFEEGKPLFRTTLEMTGFPSLGTQTGMAFIVSRLRPAGSNEWLLSQEYPLQVEVITPEAGGG